MTLLDILVDISTSGLDARDEHSGSANDHVPRRRDVLQGWESNDGGRQNFTCIVKRFPRDMAMCLCLGCKAFDRQSMCGLDKFSNIE